MQFTVSRHGLKVVRIHLQDAAQIHAILHQHRGNVVA
jgi:hypothetical protein